MCVCVCECTRDAVCDLPSAHRVLCPQSAAPAARVWAGPRRAAAVGARRTAERVQEARSDPQDEPRAREEGG